MSESNALIHKSQYGDNVQLKTFRKFSVILRNLHGIALHVGPQNWIVIITFAVVQFDAVAPRHQLSPAVFDREDQEISRSSRDTKTQIFIIDPHSLNT